MGGALSVGRPCAGAPATGPEHACSPPAGHVVNHPATHIRIVIAGEHAIFRHGLRRLLEARDGLRVYEVGDATSAVALVRGLPADILLLGLNASKHPSLEILRELSASAHSTRTIVLTDRIDSPDVISALQLGARAVLAKDSRPDVLFTCIESVMAGHFWFGQESAAGAMPGLRKLEAERRQSKVFGLTRREIQIVRAVVAGCTNKEIAERSSISENTVKSHLTHIFNKIGASNRVELALFAAHHRLLDGV
jgi:two-component system, NarL family, nitrate/nitrite response regulator NarL